MKRKKKNKGAKDSTKPDTEAAKSFADYWDQMAGLTEI